MRQILATGLVSSGFSIGVNPRFLNCKAKTNFKTYSEKWGARAHRRALEGDGSFLKCCGNDATALNTN